MKDKLLELLPYLCILVLIPGVIAGGVLLFPDRSYAWIALSVAILSFLPLVVRFEQKRRAVQELVVLAVLSALSALSRVMFVWIPSIKPSAAVIIIVAIYLGKEAGFIVGSMTALISNFYFGQGLWTPFQMISWGLVGFLAGILANPLRRHMLLLLIYGFVAGFLYSMVMDLWSVLWMDNALNLSRYFSTILLSMTVTIKYAISNVIFLIPSWFLGKILGRLQTKYGLFPKKKKACPGN